MAESRIIFYDKSGKESEEKNAVAKLVDKSSTTHYILEYCGELVTKDTVTKRADVGRLKFRKVGPKSFANYLKYLNTNMVSYYNLAIRNSAE